MRFLPSNPVDAGRAPMPDAARIDWLRRWRFAHRGLHGAGAPENSPAAFAAAIDRGMGIECDVQRSVDGQAMVFHDWELDRLTGEVGPVAARSAAELGCIALTGVNDTIPNFAQVLHQIANRVPLLIEIKSRRDRRVAPLCLAVRRALEGYRGDVAVMSFDPRVCRWFAHYSPLTLRGLVMTEDGEKGIRGRLRRHLAVWSAQPEFLAYDIRDLPSRFAAAQRARGLPLLTWTVKTPDLAARAAAHADAPIAEGAGIA